MKTPAAALLLVTVLVLGLALPAAVPAADNEDATIGLVLVEQSGRVRCNYEPPDCEDEDNLLAGEFYTEYYAYLIVFNGDAETGLAGVSCSIRYDGASNSGVDIIEWNKCATQAFNQPSWPAPGSGLILAWDTVNHCQTEEPGGFGEGVSAVMGYFLLSAVSDDLMEIIPHPATGRLSIADCNAAEFTLGNDQAGALAFSDDGSVPGRRGCFAPEIFEATWGDIKQTYGSNR